MTRGTSTHTSSAGAAKMFRGSSQVCLLALCLLGFANASSLKHFSEFMSHRTQDFQDATQVGCIKMVGLPGRYWYSSEDGQSNVCVLFFIGLPESLVEIKFDYFSIDCDKQGLLGVVDGWEMNGQMFPNMEDHRLSLAERYKTFCGKRRPTKIYVSSQNIAMIHHRIPKSGQGFMLEVNFIPNSRPCNAILMDKQGVYTLRNYGSKNNCSISIIYSERVKLLNVDVGVEGSVGVSQQTRETGVLTRCSKRNLNDFVEFRTGNGMDPGQMTQLGQVCGLDSYPKFPSIDLTCQHSVVRMVSSGDYDNSVTFMFDEIPPDQNLQAFLCTP